MNGMYALKNETTGNFCLIAHSREAHAGASHISSGPAVYRAKRFLSAEYPDNKYIVYKLVRVTRRKT